MKKGKLIQGFQIGGISPITKPDNYNKAIIINKGDNNDNNFENKYLSLIRNKDKEKYNAALKYIDTIKDSDIGIDDFFAYSKKNNIFGIPTSKNIMGFYNDYLGR